VVSTVNNLACNLAYHNGDLDEAHELALKARDLPSSDANVADTLGWILYFKKEYLQCISPLRESLSKNFENAEGHYRLASVLYMIGDEEAARQEFEQALAKQLTGFDQADARRKLDLLGVSRGKLTPSAEASLERLMKAKSPDPGVLLRIGENEAAQGNYEKALKLLQQAVEANPQNGMLLLSLARSTFARGDFAAAMEFVSNARKIMPDNVEIVAFLGGTRSNWPRRRSLSFARTWSWSGYLQSRRFVKATCDARFLFWNQLPRVNLPSPSYVTSWV